jgi:hypothetical protein
LALDTPTLKSVSADAPNKLAELSQALREWWLQETTDWDLRVAASGNETNSDLWDSMPTVDSKTVARTSPIFQKHLGCPLDVKLIRPGGYESFDDMINHVVPAMIEQLKRR